MPRWRQLDLLDVDVGPDDLVADAGERHARHQSDVPGAHHRNLQPLASIVSLFSDAMACNAPGRPTWSVRSRTALDVGDGVRVTTFAQTRVEVSSDRVASCRSEASSRSASLNLPRCMCPFLLSYVP